MAQLHSVPRIPNWPNVSKSFPQLCRELISRILSFCQGILFLIFGRSEFFIGMVGFFALGLESTLPIPQLIRLGSLVPDAEYFADQLIATTGSARYMVSGCLL